jgi:putative spermidine/putrescine transport system permease protein
LTGVASTGWRSRERRGVDRIRGLRRRGAFSPHSLAIWLISLIALAFLMAPTIFVLMVAFDPARFVSFPPRGLTLGWFARIDSSFWSAFRMSLELAATSTVVGLVLGTAAAVAIVRGRFFGRGASSALARAPLQMPYIVIGIAFLQFYRLIVDHGGPELNGTFIGLLIAHVVVTVPFALAAAITGLLSCPANLEAAAHSLGMGKTRTFFAVTLSTIRPSLLAGAFFAFLISFDNVPVSLYLAGTHETLPVLMFQTANTAPSPSLYAISAIVTVLSVVAVVAVNKFVGLRAAGMAR